MPGAELQTKLPRVIAVATCTRLACLSLTLPSSLFKQGDPSAQDTQDYLAHLLDHDPASFLERYGKHLHGEELAAFEPLCHDYEVQFWVNTHRSSRVDTTGTGTASASGQSPGIAVSAKNRRLAAMQRLHAVGEFFSMESMQERDPTLYHQYIGQYAEAEDDDDEQQEEEANAEMVARFHQAQLRARMEELKKEQTEEQVSEHESDDDSEGECAPGAADRMQLDEKPVQAQRPLRGPAIRGIPAGRLKSVPAAKPAGRRREVGAAGAQNGARQQQQQGQQRQQQQQQQASPASQPSAAPKPARAASSVRFAAPVPAGPASAPQCCGRPTQERGRKRDLQDNQRQLVQEMEARFLSGGDAVFVDYATIDADTQLDDDWLEQRGRDAEDAYFDEDAAEGSTGCEQPGQAGAARSAEVGGEELEEWERMALDPPAAPRAPDHPLPES